MSYITRFIAIILLISVFIGGQTSFAITTQSTVDSKNAEIRQLEAQLKSVQNQKATTAQQKSAKEAEVKSLQTKIASLNSDIQKIQSQLKEVNTQITDTEKSIVDTQNTIQSLEQEIISQKAVIQVMVQDLYKRSLIKNEVVAVVSADSLSEAFSEIQYSNDLQSDIQSKVTQLNQKRSELDVQNQELSNKKASLASVQDNLEEQKSEVETIKNQTQKQVSSSQIAANQLNASLNQLNSTEKSLEEKRQSALVELSRLEAELSKKYGGGGGTVCSARGYAWPVQGGRITQGYGFTSFARSGAYSGYMHNGIDIASSTGTPIYATASGTVVSVGFNDLSYGKWVVIRHNDGYFSLYGHLSAQRVSNGQVVERGQRIGDMGSTGFSTGPHLHFTIYLPNSLRLGSSPQGASVNPSTCGY